MDLDKEFLGPPDLKMFQSLRTTRQQLDTEAGTARMQAWQARSKQAAIQRLTAEQQMRLNAVSASGLV